MPELGELRGDPGVVVGRLAREHEQLLDVALDGAVEDPLDLGRLVQVRLVGRERAVLAVAPARPGQRERQISRERDPAAHPPHRTLRRCEAAPLVAAARALAGCGGATGGDRPNETATLLLDFTPNAVHAGIYVASERGFDTAEGVKLEIRKPSASTDALKLLQGGRADLAILDIHDLGIAREKGRDLVGVMALVQRPLAAVLAQPGIRTPEGPRGQARRRHGAAVGLGRAALGRRGRGRRRRPRARDDDRLRGGQGAARRPRRGGDRVLERRGRRPAREAPGHPRVPRRRLRRARPTRSSS